MIHFTFASTCLRTFIYLSLFFFKFRFLGQILPGQKFARSRTDRSRSNIMNVARPRTRLLLLLLSREYVHTRTCSHDAGSINRGALDTRYMHIQPVAKFRHFQGFLHGHSCVCVCVRIVNMRVRIYDLTIGT